jgi:hypothetical protein
MGHTIHHHRKARTMNDRDPRYAHGRVWGLVALYMAAALALAALAGLIIYLTGASA